MAQGDWMVSFDLQDGYHCISIHPDFRKFMTFQLPSGELIQMSGLPFGWNASPYVFCHVMKVMVRALRAPTYAQDQEAIVRFDALLRRGTGAISKAFDISRSQAGRP